MHAPVLEPAALAPALTRRARGRLQEAANGVLGELVLDITDSTCSLSTLALASHAPHMYVPAPPPLSARIPLSARTIYVENKSCRAQWVAAAAAVVAAAAVAAAVVACLRGV